MPLSSRAAHYLIHQFPDSGRSVEELAGRWVRAYPKDPISVKEAEDFIVRAMKLMEGGESLHRCVEEALKPDLKVVAKPKKAKVAKKK